MQTSLYSSSMVEIGRWQLRPEYDQFHETGYVDQPLMVFPKNPIWIKHENKSAFVADTSIINFYNQGQVYSRSAIDPGGDDCHNFWLSEEILDELVGGGVASDPIFTFENLACSTQTFELQLQILQTLATDAEIDSLEIEDLAIQLFSSALGPQSRNRACEYRQESRVKQRSRDIRLIESVKSQLQLNLHENLSLADLAKANHVSPYHLSRLFTLYCGQGMSKYRMLQRLRRASFLIIEGVDLTEVALDSGFSSHSHLSASFKKHFGRTPTELKAYRSDSKF